MNIFGITFTQGARAAAAVKSTGAVETAKAAQATQGMGVGQVHDQIDLSVDGVRAAETASDIRFDRVAAIRTAIAHPRGTPCRRPACPPRPPRPTCGQLR